MSKRYATTDVRTFAIPLSTRETAYGARAASNDLSSDAGPAVESGG